MSLTDREAASLADLERIWQVRRFCQVNHGASLSHHPLSAPWCDAPSVDAALPALLRCLLHDLDVDIAATSLLDAQNRHFLSVVTASTANGPSLRSDSWFGCQATPVKGCICARTITRERHDSAYPVFEIMDLQADEDTCCLPVVNGTLASFRYYAGVPISFNGLNVGALFVFKNERPAQPLSLHQRRFLWEMARHTMDHIARTISALEHERFLRCSLAASSLLGADVLTSNPKTTQLNDSPTGLHKGDVRHLESDLFETAASIISEALELEGVLIQASPRSASSVTVRSQQRRLVLAEHYEQEARGPLPAGLADRLLALFPSGVVLQLVSAEHESEFLASDRAPSKPRARVQFDLCQSFPGIQQCIFMPIGDSFDDCNVAFVFGWTSSMTRVYDGTIDLSSLSSLTVAITAQLRRIETQDLSRKKADFVGSVSHEMLSPLHGVLACLEHVQSMQCSAEQLDLLQSAEVCALQLHNNINKVLAFSNIAQPGSTPDSPPTPDFSDTISHHHRIDRNRFSVLSLLEDIIDRVASCNRLLHSSFTSQRDLLRLAGDGPRYNPLHPDDYPVVSVDASLDVDLPLSQYSALSTVVSNVLDNCFKFSSGTGYIRVVLEAGEQDVTLRFLDFGRGMSPDFVRHKLFEPFAQQDPLDQGVGLGLTLIRDAVRELGGQMNIDTNQMWGTEFTVSLPSTRPALSRQPSSKDNVPSARPILPLPASFTVRLFALLRWRKASDVRHRRCLDALVSSLASTFTTWLDLEFRVWEPGEALPQMFVVLDTDLAALKESTSDASDGILKLVLRADVRSEAPLAASQLDAVTTLSGLLSPSRICTAVATLLKQDQDRVKKAGREDSLSPLSQNAMHDVIGQRVPDGASRNDSQVSPASPGIGRCTTPRKTDRGIARLDARQTPEPSLLLVDDNLINLKVADMYAKRCSSVPCVLAESGQQAIDEFKRRRLDANDHPAAPPFDVVLLDLSMPCVSGFDVALAIREMEGLAIDGPRTYIAALTGLSSDKDREAAFAAGVDEYVTKPAQLKDIKRVISNWRSARGIPDA